MDEEMRGDQNEIDFHNRKREQAEGAMYPDSGSGPASGEVASYSALSDEDLTILHAAMTAMTKGIHACQSNLSDEEWERAEEIWDELDDEINSRAL